MPGDPSSCCVRRLCSWLSRFKEHVFAPFAPASPISSHQYSRLPDDGIDAPAHCADVSVSPAPATHHALGVPEDSTADSMPACPSPCLSPSPPTSLLCLHPPLSPSGAEKLEALNHHVDSQLSPESVSHDPSTSRLSVHPVANPVPTHPPQSLSPLPLGTPFSIANLNTSLPLPTSGYNTADLDSPHHTADTKVPPAFPPHPPSASQVPTPSTLSAACAGPILIPCPFTRGVVDQPGQNYWLTYPTPPCPPQLIPRETSTYQGPSHMFSEAHNFTVKDSTFIQSNTATDNFMKDLLQETIIGAEFDSSARDPPPRCHPGTRLAIIQRCLDFIAQCLDEEKVRWVVGPAGVGKSAIMQMVTENVPDGIVFASVFLSVNGRSDGSKTILTIAYQLAVKCGPYRQFIRDQITFDPSLLKKSMSVQFNKFIVEPFMFGRLFKPSRRFLVAIDGLDECDDRLIQRKLLELITDFCITHPTSPISWIIASRPEPHITLFFDKAEVRQVYTKEEVKIDSDKACEEVQRFLRDELKKIKTEHPTLRYKREWPLEHEFTKIASAAGGLFAYAATVIRFIADPTHRGPAAQLRRVIELVDASPKDSASGRDHPMDQLDALYRRILSNVPDSGMPNTRKLLILHSYKRFTGLGFRTQCNALGLTEEDAYDAVCHLHAVMKIPKPDKADDNLSYYHKSFGDFLHDFERSGFSRNFSLEGFELDGYTSLRIIEDLHDDGVARGEDIRVASSSVGLLKGCCDNISLSWPGDERFERTDEAMRTTLYEKSTFHVLLSFDADFQRSISCFHVLTTCFTIASLAFPFDALLASVFEQFRDEVAKPGKLKQAPLRTFDYAAICRNVELRFTSPTDNNLKVSEPWNPSCKHDQTSVNGLEPRRGWSTKFKRYHTIDSVAEDDEDTDIPRFRIAMYQQQHEKWAEHDTKYRSSTMCLPCTRRFARHFMNNQDLLATYFVDGTQMCYVEVTFVDPDDGVSEWRYQFLYSGCPSSLDA